MCWENYRIAKFVQLVGVCDKFDRQNLLKCSFRRIVHRLAPDCDGVERFGARSWRDWWWAVQHRSLQLLLQDFRSWHTKTVRMLQEHHLGHRLTLQVLQSGNCSLRLYGLRLNSHNLTWVVLLEVRIRTEEMMGEDLKISDRFLQRGRERMCVLILSKDSLKRTLLEVLSLACRGKPAVSW